MRVGVMFYHWTLMEESMMETIFKGTPIETTIFNYDGLEIAYVLFEDEGDCWGILASLGDNIKEEGSVLQMIDKDIYHPMPRKYAQERYESAVQLIEKLLISSGSPQKLTLEKRKWS